MPSIRKLTVMATHGHLASQCAGCKSFNTVFHQYMYFNTQFENIVTKPTICAQQLLTHSPFYHIIGVEAWVD